MDARVEPAHDWLENTCGWILDHPLTWMTTAKCEA
jgi:hypothetical protein